MKVVETRVFEFDESQLKELFEECMKDCLSPQEIEENFKDDDYLIDWLVNDGSDELEELNCCRYAEQDYKMMRG